MLSRPPDLDAGGLRAASCCLNLGAAPPAERLLASLGDGAAFLLESGGGPGELARWSFAGSHPVACFVSKGGDNRFHWFNRRLSHAWREEPLAALRRVLACFAPCEPRDAAPFAGGAVGYFAYELGRRLLPLPILAEDDLGLPDISLFFYDRWMAVDHARGRLYAGAYAQSSDRTQAQGEARRLVEQVAEDWLAAARGDVAVAPPAAGRAEALAVRSLLDATAYRRAVDICREAIRAGEAYELCLTTRFEAAYEGDPADLYRALRQESPAPFAAFLRHPELTLAGASPERFLRLAPDGFVQARPIKGTRPRGADPAKDARLRQELAASAKDRAENVMIVDLLRNDLSRVCAPGSVSVRWRKNLS